MFLSAPQRCEKADYEGRLLNFIYGWVENRYCYANNIPIKSNEFDEYRKALHEKYRQFIAAVAKSLQFNGPNLSSVNEYMTRIADEMDELLAKMKALIKEIPKENLYVVACDVPEHNINMNDPDKVLLDALIFLHKEFLVGYKDSENRLQQALRGLETIKKEEKYQAAVKALDSCIDYQRAETIMTQFRELGNYKDSKMLAVKAAQLSESLHRKYRFTRCIVSFIIILPFAILLILLIIR